MVSAAELPPGGEGSIEVKLTTAGRKGPLDKTITVTSNDPAMPQFHLKMKGTVEVVAAFEPSPLSWGRLAAGATMEQVVPVVGRDATKVKLGTPKPSDDRLKVDVVTADGKPALKVSFAAGDKLGRFNATVSVPTGLESPASLLLAINAEVSADLFAVPALVRLGAVDPAKPGVPVEIQSLSGKPFKVLGVDDATGAIQAKPAFANGKWTIDVKRVSDKADGGNLKVKTDRKDQAVIDLPWSTAAVGRAAVPTERIVPSRSLLPKGAAEGVRRALPIRPGANVQASPTRAPRPAPAPASK
ncbi:MAG: DUF1573 domain-containing protein [Deltaproteobacteria bacterium]|nr:DUF1573 domain-containing protein [Deltaproteobacteria bacterium]